MHFNAVCSVDNVGVICETGSDANGAIYAKPEVTQMAPLAQKSQCTFFNASFGLKRLEKILIVICSNQIVVIREKLIKRGTNPPSWGCSC